ncbi:PilZ domain-containing protein [Hyphococcus sp.]|uniref:PilZ domain-containing protein n=2 Tax=Hyphococcus sp. TaxID=2038636 RepID=UPI0035C66AC5
MAQQGMDAMYEKEEMSVAPNRKSFRFDYAAPIDIVRELERQSFGAVINVSRGGVAFRAFMPLKIGAKYEFNIRGVGSLPGTIMRRFGGTCYAARFDVDEAQKRSIDKTLAAIFGTEGEGDTTASEKADFSS